MTNWEIRKVSECLSTNNFIKEEKKKGMVCDKTAILTDFQSAGRGQGSNIWFSDRGKNFLGSFYRNVDLKVDKHFMLTIITSLAICDFLNKIGVKPQIKWPNDIYSDDKKIAGILIENSLMSDLIKDTIIGIGLNVNQNSFPNELPNPISIFQLLEEEIDLESITNGLINELDNYFNLSFEGKNEDLFHLYNEKLYRLKEWHLFEFDNHRFNAQIRGVMPDGRLIVEMESGQLKHFLFGEIKHVIEF